MQLTLEVRWFYPGPPPDALRAWFGTPETATRTDVYGRPTSDDLNIKVRAGGLEVKRRVEPPRPVRFSDRIEGQAERWMKWRFPLAHDHAHPHLEQALAGSGHWVPVQKTRALRQFVVDGAALRPRVGPPPPGTAGCDVELTRLVASDAEWWSVCLEALGPRNHQHAALLLAARHVFDGAAPPLAADRSRGYAAWLRALEP